ncbi:MAG: nucleoside recognition domain-containing protein [Polyangiaceae bacterium]
MGTVILAFSVLLWALLTVTVRPASYPDEPAIERSVAATMGRALEPVTRPIGFDWRINVGLIASFGARELMVSTLGVIFGVEGANDDPAPLASKISEAKSADGTKAYSSASALRCSRSLSLPASA